MFHPAHSGNPHFGLRAEEGVLHRPPPRPGFNPNGPIRPQFHPRTPGAPVPPLGPRMQSPLRGTAEMRPTRPPFPPSSQGPITRPPFPPSSQGPITRPPFPPSSQGPINRPPFNPALQGPNTRPPFLPMSQGPTNRPPFLPTSQGPSQYGIRPPVGNMPPRMPHPSERMPRPAGPTVNHMGGGPVPAPKQPARFPAPVNFDLNVRHQGPGFRAPQFM